LHLHRTSASASLLRKLSRAVLAAVAVSGATLALAACGNTYRPVVSAINPVGPAGQPTKYAVAISTTGPRTPGLVTLVDFSGDTVLNTTLIGVNPLYLQLANTGFEGYTLNGDGTLTSFSVSSSLLASEVLQSTFFANANPVAIYSQGTFLYIAETARNSVAELSGLPPAIQQELPTGAGTIYTVGASGSPRAYALVTNGAGNGSAVPIETANNTTDAAIPVGVNPTYGVMTSDSRRAFILNKGSNNVSVINAQTNAPDAFFTNGCNPAVTTPCTVTSTIPVGTAPVWADFAPTFNEILVANQGNATSPCADGVTLGCGSVTIISIPLCSATTVTTNPNCDTSNPIDAVGFGTVIANIPVGVNPIMIGVMQDGTEAFVANAGSAATASNPASCVLPAAGHTPNCSVTVINLTTNTVVATVPFIASGNEGDSFGHGHPNYIGVTTGTPTGKVYVTAGDSTDITIIRSDNNLIQTHLPLQGNGVSVRMSAP
jgi:DNA-binding beta-propeller fold protein YncE